MSAPDVSMPEQAPVADQAIATGGTPNTSQQAAATNVAQSLSDQANSERPTFQPDKPSVWKAVLAGALSGLAGAGPARSFGGGLIGGAAGAIAAGAGIGPSNQDLLDQAQARTDHFQMASAQAASLVADAHIKDLQLQAMPTDIKNRQLAAELANDESLRARGYEPTIISDNTTDGGATAALNQLTDSHGAVPPMYIGHLGDSHVGYSLPQQDPGDLKLVNDRAAITGAPEWDTSTWARLPQTMRDKIKHDAMSGFGTEASTDASSAQALALKYKNMATTYAAKANPDPDTLAQLQAAQGRYESDVKSWDAHTNSQLQKKNDIESSGKVDVAQAVGATKNAGKSVYAVNSDGQTVLTTQDEATQGGMKAIRPVNQTQIAGDVHNNAVLEDVSRKVNDVIDSAKALDQNTIQRSTISAALASDSLKLGAHAAGIGFEVPTEWFTNWAKTQNQAQATPATMDYVNNVLQLREASMGLNKVLTGSARASETQIAALQATLPGFENSSATALQKVSKFAGNIDALRSSIPIIPGTPRTAIKKPAPSGTGSSW